MTQPAIAPSTVRISEVFGPTIQGEGPAAGQRAFFIRLAGCPVGCTWCDTRYSWDPAARDPTRQSQTVDISALTHDAIARSTESDIIVITGGEPLAQPAALANLVTQLKPHRPRVHLETAGMPGADRELLEQFDVIVVSPKLRNAGPQADQHMQLHEYADLAGLEHAWFKFVVQCKADLDAIAQYEDALGLARIMVMVEGSDPRHSLQDTAAFSDDIIARGWSISPRLHIWLWGNEPGR